MDAAGGAGDRHLPRASLLRPQAAAVVYLRSPHRQRRCGVRPMPLVQRAQRSRVSETVSVLRVVSARTRVELWQMHLFSALVHTPINSVPPRTAACPTPVPTARSAIRAGSLHWAPKDARRGRLGRGGASSHALSSVGVWVSQPTASELTPAVMPAAQTDGMTLDRDGQHARRISLGTPRSALH
jgi:hypothetical protein